MSFVFINYRRQDDPYAAALLDEWLSKEFGSENVFRASRSIRPGNDYEVALRKVLSQARVMLALIGRHWEDAVAPAERWANQEISIALTQGMRVIPLLLGDVKIPKPEELPEPIVDLARLQYLRLDDRYIMRDMQYIVQELKELMKEEDGREPPDRVAEE